MKRVRIVHLQALDSDNTETKRVFSVAVELLDGRADNVTCGDDAFDSNRKSYEAIDVICREDAGLRAIISGVV